MEKSTCKPSSRPPDPVVLLANAVPSTIPSQYTIRIQTGTFRNVLLRWYGLTTKGKWDRVSDCPPWSIALEHYFQTKRRHSNTLPRVSPGHSVSRDDIAEEKPSYCERERRYGTKEYDK
eukprot:scaffold4770_cov177-Amphora_coffeaeformis.AAC.2